MKRYRKQQPALVSKQVEVFAPILGMLYVVDVRLVPHGTDELIKHRVLLVGGEADDVERKVRWIFDCSKYSEFSVTAVEKVRDKVHILSTTITQLNDPDNPVIDRDGRSQIVSQNKTLTEPYDPKLFAVGVTTTVLARDEEHALRKVGRALVARASNDDLATTAKLSRDSTVVVEAIPKASAYARPRDMSQETNRAHIMGRRWV